MADDDIPSKFLTDNILDITKYLSNDVLRIIIANTDINSHFKLSLINKSLLELVNDGITQEVILTKTFEGITSELKKQKKGQSLFCELSIPYQHIIKETEIRNGIMVFDSIYSEFKIRLEIKNNIITYKLICTIADQYDIGSVFVNYTTSQDLIIALVNGFNPKTEGIKIVKQASEEGNSDMLQDNPLYTHIDTLQDKFEKYITDNTIGILNNNMITRLEFYDYSEDLDINSRIGPIIDACNAFLKVVALKSKVRVGTSGGSVLGNHDNIYILGRKRKITKVGRLYMITYNKTQISLASARKLEKQLLKNKNSTAK